MEDFYLQEKQVCKSCVKDPFLKERIFRVGRLRKCGYCDTLENCVPLRQIANWVKVALNQTYREGEQEPVFDEDDRISNEQNGEEFLDILSFHFGAEPKLFDDIAAMLTEPKGEGLPDFSQEGRYIEINEFRDTAVREWEEIKHELRHHSRYFNLRVRNFFDSLFADIKTAKAGGFFWNEVVRVFEPNEGHTFYRARVAIGTEELNSILLDPIEGLGPPPPVKASAGRMNFEGSSVFYGAFKRETSIAELRPSLGSTVVSAEFKFREGMRILDLLALDRSGQQGDLSLFQPDYYQRRITRSFIRLFHKEVRRPVIPGCEHEYLVTQVLSDYLTNAQSPPIDGMLFSSVQHDGGINLVLFNGLTSNYSADKGAVMLVPGSVRIHTIEGIHYTSTSGRPKI